jgi:BCD family chlorophyll transporter-like MFS transporter
VSPLGWLGIGRLGLVQAALGSVVVLATSTLNRVMVVEWALPAIVPGLLVALHYGVQVLRPLAGHGSDGGGRRTPWIVGGMLLLAAGGVAAAAATGWMGTHRLAGIALAVLAFAAIGVGVGAAGTSLLVLLAARVAPARRAAAAMTVWIMMIAGFGVTAGVAGKLLDPFSPARLVAVTTGVACVALLLTLAGVWGIEGRAVATPTAAVRAGFVEALRDVWSEPAARRFAIFVFVSMLAYSGQELILEPFAGSVFGLTPGGSAQLTGVQHGGALLGMLLVGIAGRRPGFLRGATILGCAGSAAALLALAAAGWAGPAAPLRACVFALGVANGAFAVAAIGAMMGLVHTGRPAREGVRMGIWGAAQAVAFACGGLAATIGSDCARSLLGSPRAAYAAVFVAEALLFVVAARLALLLFHARSQSASNEDAAAGGLLAKPG